MNSFWKQRLWLYLGIVLTLWYLLGDPLPVSTPGYYLGYFTVLLVVPVLLFEALYRLSKRKRKVKQ